MKWKTFLQIVILIFIAGIVFYFAVPKYEIYQSARDGTVTYRFNTITGTLKGLLDNRWSETVPLGFIKKP